MVRQFAWPACSLLLMLLLAGGAATDLAGSAGVGHDRDRKALGSAIARSRGERVTVGDIPLEVRGPNVHGHLEFMDPSDGSLLVLIRRGAFVFGDDAEAAYRGQTIFKRQVRETGDCLIDKHPVTMLRYERFASATRARIPRDLERASRDSWSRLPIVGVSWVEADAFCRWSKRDLPTEEEWEKAARGLDGRKFPWGNSDPDGTRIPYRGPTIDATSVVIPPGRDVIPELGVHPAGASPFGVEDIVGTIREYCKDDYRPAGPPVLSVANEPASGDPRRYKVIRGSSWRTPAEWTGCVERGPKAMDEAELEVSGEPKRANDCGFRTVIRLTPSEIKNLGLAR